MSKQQSKVLADLQKLPSAELYGETGVAVSKRSFARQSETDGSWENWEGIATRVPKGNCSLVDDPDGSELSLMTQLMRVGILLMSGRHLQQGDENQSLRNLEIFTNCSTSCTSSLLFQLLLNGSGVGRSYDDVIQKVDWRDLPPVWQYLSPDHEDFELLREKLPEVAELCISLSGSPLDPDALYVVEDSREGWAQAIEHLETAAWKNTSKPIILDYSGVRCKGSPIGGMQDRPASGPVPMMEAVERIKVVAASSETKLWKQAIFVHHYLSECVVVGGARRSAGMATKIWTDPDAVEFATIKSDHDLWTANNSITVDKQFWDYVNQPVTGNSGSLHYHAHAVFDAAVRSLYRDGKGEPGFINQDSLNVTPLPKFDKNTIGSDRFLISDDHANLLQEIGDSLNQSINSSGKNYSGYIVNPCVTADTMIETSEGLRPVRDLINTPFAASVNGKEYPSHKGFWSTGAKEVLEVSTDRGYSIKATKNHKLLVERKSKKSISQEWVEVKDLKPGDKLILNDNSKRLRTLDPVQVNKGWILGQVVGDGGYNPDKYPGYVRFWGEESKIDADAAKAVVNQLPRFYESPIAPHATASKGSSTTVGGVPTYNVASRAIDELCDKYITPGEKLIKDELLKSDLGLINGFLRGLFDTDGSPQGNHLKGNSVRLSQSGEKGLQRLLSVQQMLLLFGVNSKIYLNRKLAGLRMMPDSNGELVEYECQAVHELIISKSSIYCFANLIGFRVKSKHEALNRILASNKRGLYAESYTATVTGAVSGGVEEVYDCTVEEVHRFSANGIIAHNCGEIVLNIMGAYCTIADLAPFFAPNLDAFKEASAMAARALIRTNTMDSLYHGEVDRTNRIGVGLTGVHEYAWNEFGYSFYDLLDEEKSKDFWLTISDVAYHTVQAADSYADELGVQRPHTLLTAKPSGTVSKLFGLSEGIHLPEVDYYLRNVQYQNGDPKIEEFRKLGYPVRELSVSYKDVTIVGFPTVPRITELGIGDKLVTAEDISPEQHYQYLMLMEKYWLNGCDSEGTLRTESRGNQLSYTLIVDIKVTTFQEFENMVRKYQPLVRCCAVLPTGHFDYEYLPNERVTREEFDTIKAQISNGSIDEDVGIENVQCAGGACPIEFN